MRLRAALALAMMMASTAGACRRSSDVTGLRIVVSFSVPVEQIQFGITRDGNALLAPVPRPGIPKGMLASPADVVVYLPDDVAGTDVECTASLLYRGDVVGTASHRVRVELNEVVTVRLSPSITDGGVDLPLDKDAAADQAPPDSAVDQASADQAPFDQAPVDQSIPWDGAPRATGLACNSNEECGSTFCVDGICCEAACGPCQQCNAPGKYGTCTYVAAGRNTGDCPDDGAGSCGRDGTCDGNGGCRLYQVGVPCQMASCGYAAGEFRPPSTCDGLGHCTAAALVSCAPYRCNQNGCISSCSSDGDCVSGSNCASSTCTGAKLKSYGETCTDSSQCTGGICADGVCCRTACTESCTKCDATGTCAAVAAGTPDPRNKCDVTGATSCGFDGTCDGAGACRMWPAGTSCAGATSNKNSCGGTRSKTLNAYQCDGAGNCGAVTIDCSPYLCVSNPPPASCRTSCLTSSDCVTGFQCVSGLCGGVAPDAGTGG